MFKNLGNQNNLIFVLKFVYFINLNASLCILGMNEVGWSLDPDHTTASGNK